VSKEGIVLSELQNIGRDISSVRAEVYDKVCYGENAGLASLYNYTKDITSGNTKIEDVDSCLKQLEKAYYQRFTQDKREGDKSALEGTPSPFAKFIENAGIKPDQIKFGAEAKKELDILRPRHALGGVMDFSSVINSKQTQVG